MRHADMTGKPALSKHVRRANVLSGNDIMVVVNFAIDHRHIVAAVIDGDSPSRACTS